MESDDLMTEDVLSSLERGRNSDGKGVVLANHLDRSPLAILITIGLNLGPFQIGLLD